jgi:hypothetical protein
MDELRVRAEAQGFFTRKDALGIGHDDQSIRRAVRARIWRRVRVGAYTFNDLWPEDPLAQYRLASRAATTKLGGRAAMSHTSAAVEHGLLLWQPDLTNVHVTRLDGGAGRTEAGLVHHEGLTMPSDVVLLRGLPVMTPARAALETASLGTAEQAVVVLDSALHLGLTTPEEVTATYALMQSWPECRGLQVAVRMADGRAESVGESRSRWLFYLQRIPLPVLQYEVRDAAGRIVGITDFAWPEHRLLGEFDGRVKYERYLREGEGPGDAVFREKRREERLCELTGWRMVRLVWADLYDASATGARIRRMLRSAA